MYTIVNIYRYISLIRFSHGSTRLRNQRNPKGPANQNSLGQLRENMKTLMNNIKTTANTPGTKLQHVEDKSETRSEQIEILKTSHGQI